MHKWRIKTKHFSFLFSSHIAVCAISNADDRLSYICTTFFRGSAHLLDINYLFFCFLFIPFLGHDWRLMCASKLPHMPAIYQLREQSCRFIPTLSGRIFMKLGKRSNFVHPLMIKKKEISHSRSFTLWVFCHCFPVQPLRKGQASLWRQILLNLAENMDLYLWVENSAIHYGHTMW